MSSYSCSPQEEEELIPSLPNDVALNCLARVPRHLHPTLSLVSKPIKSLISSPLLFNTRSAIHATQPILFLRLRPKNSRSHSHWYELPFNPLAPNAIPLPPIPNPSFSPSSYTLLVGSHLYVLGAPTHRDKTSIELWILDCRFKRWRHGPTLHLPRQSTITGKVHEDKIYVMYSHKSKAKMLDPSAVDSNWEDVSVPNCIAGVNNMTIDDCEVALGGRVYAFVGYLFAAYDMKSGVWEKLTAVEYNLLVKFYVDAEFRSLLSGGPEADREMCVIDLELGLGERRPLKWKKVRGLKGDLRRLCFERGVIVSGNLFIVSTCTSPLFHMDFGTPPYILCSQVQLHRNKGEFWGKISWSRQIFSSSDFFTLDACFAADL